jgi:hypothetical protein
MKVARRFVFAVSPLSIPVCYEVRERAGYVSSPTGTSRLPMSGRVVKNFTLA